MIGPSIKKLLIKLGPSKVHHPSFGLDPANFKGSHLNSRASFDLYARLNSYLVLQEEIPVWSPKFLPSNIATRTGFSNQKGFRPIISKIHVIVLTEPKQVSMELTSSCSETLVHGNRDESVRLAIRELAEERYPIAATYPGSSALHKAVMMGDVKAVYDQLDDDTDVDVQDDKGLSPVRLAVANGHEEIVRILLDWAAEVTADPRGVTPLHVAAWRGDTRMAELLLTATVCEMSAKTIGLGWTALHGAAYEGHDQVVRALLGYDDLCDVNAEDNEGKTALQLAEERGHEKVIEELKG
jgi:hypothetical protein